MPNFSSLSILCYPIEEVDVVDAPNLSSFQYVNKDKSMFCPLSSYSGMIINLRSLNIATFQNLRMVKIMKTTIIDEGALFRLIQKLPFMKELSLCSFVYWKNIKFSSSTLKVCSIVE